MRRALLTAICAAVVGLGSTAPAQGAFDDPLFVLTPHLASEAPPAGYLDGPCGLALDTSSHLYVSDYYHRAVDLYNVATTTPFFQSQPLIGPGSFGNHSGPVDDPCGLALDAAGTLYLNNYHRNVVRFPAPVSLGSGTVIDSGDPSDGAINPTGVAVDPATNRVYVDDRTYVAVYDSSGAPVPDGPEPLRIGEGTLGDGYGIAVSRFPATAGYLYVPDASTDTVKVYDPASDTVNPVATITGPPGGFGSLHDSAVAVDNSSGEVYVIDTRGPQFTERPEATVYVFTALGAYEGRLKRNVIDAAPSGLAVDNSGGGTQGRVYVTSGITENASVYGYPAHAATNVALPPIGAQLRSTGDSPLPVDVPAAASKGPAEASSPTPQASTSAVAQKGNLRVSVDGRLSPKRLPRKGTAPIKVSVGGQISTTDESLPPQLQSLRIELNRHGQLDYEGLPTCDYNRIQPGSTSRALAACRSSLVGEGSFAANIILSGQEPYPTEGKLVLFNGTRGGKPVLYGHIYSPRPFATSFVIVFAIRRLGNGTYGTSLDAPLPKAMKSWGRLTGLEMTLSRRYSAGGESHSFLSSGCPAPKGFGAVSFPLARTSFAFEGGERLSSTLSGTCKVAH